MRELQWTRFDERKPTDDPIAPPREPEDESVIVSIKALRMLRKLIGNREAWSIVEGYLDEIIDSAEPVRARVCKWTWDKIGHRWNTECGDQYQFAAVLRNIADRMERHPDD